MPGMNGIDLTRKIREDSRLIKCKIAYLTIINFSKAQKKEIGKLDIADYGDTIEEALSSVKEAITLRLESLAKEHEEVPQESNEILFAEVSIFPSKSVIAML